jgi:DNA-binding helix-hairpin-helix protein with protein kinase domain
MMNLLNHAVPKVRPPVSARTHADPFRPNVLPLKLRRKYVHTPLPSPR